MKNYNIYKDKDMGGNELPLDEATVERLENTQAHTILNGQLYLGPAHAASNEEKVT